eukprot:724921-Amorphochlora_amoeboformis.AAC.1
MTPQIFINYKLKSVAHLPWRPLMYKAFNTFVDDAFAWIIEMPTGELTPHLNSTHGFVRHRFNVHSTSTRDPTRRSRFLCLPVSKV